MKTLEKNKIYDSTMYSSKQMAIRNIPKYMKRYFQYAQIWSYEQKFIIFRYIMNEPYIVES